MHKSIANYVILWYNVAYNFLGGANMKGIAFAALFVTTAIILGLDLIIYSWTDFLIMIALLFVALFIGRQIAGNSHIESFNSDFWVAGIVLIELVIVGTGIVYFTPTFLDIDLLILAQGNELTVRILAMLLTQLLGVGIGRLNDNPTEV